MFVPSLGELIIFRPSIKLAQKRRLLLLPPHAAQKPSAEPTLVQNSKPELKSKFVALGLVVTTGTAAASASASESGTPVAESGTR